MLTRDKKTHFKIPASASWSGTPAALFIRLVSDISSDLGLDQHVSRVNSGCCYRLRQLRRIQRSLDPASVATLVLAPVTSWMNYCCTVLLFLLMRRRLSETSFSEYWTLLRVLLAEQMSLTAACHTCCMMNSNGSMCLSEFFFLRPAVTVH